MAHPWNDKDKYNPHYDTYIDENAEDKYQFMHDKIKEDGKRLRAELKEFLLARGVDAIRFDTDLDGMVLDACLVMHGREVYMNGVDCFGINVETMN